MHLNIRAALSGLWALVFLVSCAAERPQGPKVVGWPGSEVFKMPPGFFMLETLELKEGRFRYWFSSDVIVRGGPKYPIVGSYEFKRDELVLSNGKVFKVRQVNGRRFLIWPIAVEYWDHRQIIPAAHLLLPVETTNSDPPSKEGFFTKEQMERSEQEARALVDRQK